MKRRKNKVERNPAKKNRENIIKKGETEKIECELTTVERLEEEEGKNTTNHQPPITHVPAPPPLLPPSPP